MNGTGRPKGLLCIYPRNDEVKLVLIAPLQSEEANNGYNITHEGRFYQGFALPIDDMKGFLERCENEELRIPISIIKLTLSAREVKNWRELGNHHELSDEKLRDIADGRLTSLD